MTMNVLETRIEAGRPVALDQGFARVSERGLGDGVILDMAYEKGEALHATRRSTDVTHNSNWIVSRGRAETKDGV